MHGLETIVAMNALKPYRVWRAFDQRFQDGVRVMAVSSFDARRKYAAEYGCGYQDCAAHRLDDEAAGLCGPIEEEADDTQRTR